MGDLCYVVSSTAPKGPKKEQSDLIGALYRIDLYNILLSL